MVAEDGLKRKTGPAVSVNTQPLELYPGAFSQDAAGYVPMAGQVPLSARQETPSLSPASSPASSQADVGWRSGKHSVDTCDVGPPFQCLDLEFLCRLELGKWPHAEVLAVQGSGTNLHSPTSQKMRQALQLA